MCKIIRGVILYSNISFSDYLATANMFVIKYNGEKRLTGKSLIKDKTFVLEIKLRYSQSNSSYVQ